MIAERRHEEELLVQPPTAVAVLDLILSFTISRYKSILRYRLLGLVGDDSDSRSKTSTRWHTHTHTLLLRGLAMLGPGLAYVRRARGMSELNVKVRVDARVQDDRIVKDDR